MCHPRGKGAGVFIHQISQSLVRAANYCNTSLFCLAVCEQSDSGESLLRLPVRSRACTHGVVGEGDTVGSIAPATIVLVNCSSYPPKGCRWPAAVLKLHNLGSEVGCKVSSKIFCPPGSPNVNLFGNTVIPRYSSASEFIKPCTCCILTRKKCFSTQRLLGTWHSY